MKKWIMPGFAGCGAVAILAVLWQASPPPSPAHAQAAAAEGEDWGSPDGGAVVIKPGGTYSVLVTDVSDNSSVFSEGRVAGHTPPGADGTHTYTLKPTTPGQAAWTFEVIAKADGTAELYVTKGGQRHLVCPLKK